MAGLNRLQHLPFPMIWSRFTSTRKDGTTIKFKIQDCPTLMYEDVMEFMLKYFMKDETWNKAIGIEREAAAIEEFYALQSSALKDNLVQVCFLDDDVQYDMRRNKPQILGFNVLTLVRREESHYDFKSNSKAIKLLHDMFVEMGNNNDVFDKYNVDEILGDAGVSVHPDYRGMKIGLELLKARIPLCKELGLKVVAATFTSKISQGAAEKCGYETYYQIPYAEFEKKFHVNFNTDTEYLKMMAYEIK